MKLLNIFKKLSTKAKALVAVVGVAAVVAIPFAVRAEYYPVRPVYDYNKAPLNGSTCVAVDNADHNRCGSLQGPVLNSFINTPSYGDERAFFDGRRSDQAANTNADQINDVTDGSKEVVLRTYVHNNANQNTNASGLGIARGTSVKISLPTDTAQVLRARSDITASNAAGVEDTTDMVGTQQFSVSYIPGSAKLLRGTAQYNLSDNIVTIGALIGDKTMDGNLPGCFDYAALVEIRVRIQVASSDLNIAKQVRKHVDGQTGNWSKKVSVAPGTQVDYLLNTQNGGTAALNDVTTRDVLPPHVKLVPGSVKYINGNGTFPQSDVNLFGGGLIGGKYNPNDNSLITFTATTQDDFDACSTIVRNVAYAKSSTTPEINDTADVTITKENCNPVTPVYSCDLLTAAKIGDNKYGFTVNYTAKDGATLKSISYNYGDGSSSTAGATTNHTYAKDGTYTISATPTFTVNGQDKAVTSQACTTKVTIAPKVVPTYTCDLLTGDKIGDRQYRFTVKATAQNGAKLKFVTYDYGDGSDKFMTDKLVTDHTYAKDGTFVARATLTFDVNGDTKVVESDKCATPVTLTSVPPVTPPTTTTPKVTVLPNTGAGNVFGIFAATTLLGAFLHRAYAGRKSEG